MQVNVSGTKETTSVFFVRVYDLNGPCATEDPTPCNLLVTLSKNKAEKFLLEQLLKASNGQLHFLTTLKQALSYLKKQGSVNGYEFSFEVVEASDSVDDLGHGKDLPVQDATLDEKLRCPDFEKVVRSKIISHFRSTGEWGRFGLFKRIADKTGFSAAYVSRILSDKQRVTSPFYLRMADVYEINFS